MNLSSIVIFVKFAHPGPGWSEWYAFDRPVYADDTPWDDKDADLDEFRIGSSPGYLCRYTEEVCGEHITDAVTVMYDDILRIGDNPDALANFLRVQFEVANASISNLRESIIAKHRDADKRLNEQ